MKGGIRGPGFVRCCSRRRRLCGSWRRVALAVVIGCAPLYTFFLYGGSSWFSSRSAFDQLPPTCKWGQPGNVWCPYTAFEVRTRATCMGSILLKLNFVSILEPVAIGLLSFA
jgi:hypothetical protein